MNAGMDINEINAAITGISGRMPLCEAMADILGRFIDCDCIITLIYDRRGDRVLERVFPIGEAGASAPEIDLDVVRSEISALTVREPFIMDAQTASQLGLGPRARAMIAPVSENNFLKGGVAVLKREGAGFEAAQLDRLYIMVKLISTSYERSMSLAESQQYLNTILESINTAIFAVSRDGTMVHFNKAAEQIFACPAEWAIGKHYFKTMSDKEREKMRSSFDYVMQTGNAYSGQFVEMTLLDNRVIYINPRICPWVNSDGEIIGAIGIMTDETENKYFQDQLVRAEKNAILGQIAAQVSHEVMSPLASIRGFARIIEKNEAEGSKYQDYARTIVKQVDRITMVVRELLDFGRPNEIQPQPVDINNSIRNAIEQTGLETARAIIVEDLDPQLPFLCGDQQKIERALSNILLNACQSMVESGVIEIETSLSADHNIVIAIKDSGCGIPRQHLKKVFDPYFTTKPDGTGLGLAIVQQTVQSHKGRIQVTSDPGVGTCFTLEFPARKDA